MAKEILVIVGLILTALGLVGIISIGYISIKIRKEETQNPFDKKKNKSTFETLIVANYASLLSSFMGLIIIIIGLMIIWNQFF